MPASRSTAIAATLLALLALGVVLIFARNRPDAFFASVLGAVIWGGVMIVVQARRRAPTPLAIRPDELPETVSLPTAVVRGVTFIALAYVLCAALSLGMHNYFAFGIALGVPIVIWHSFRRAKRTERELGGTLWAPTRFAWTSKGRGWFLVTETEPADAVESWD